MSQKKITAINLIHDWELVKIDDGQLIHVNDTLTIVYYKDVILYRVPEFFESTKVNLDKEGNVLNEELITSEKTYKYFIHKKNDSIGLKYGSLISQQTTRFSVDSFLKKKAFKDIRFSIDTSYRLAETLKIRGNNTLLEKYVPVMKRNDTYSDSIYFYFSEKLKHIDYTFSKESDSAKKMKLYKIKWIFNQAPAGKYFFEVPRRELLFEVKEAILTNEKEIIYLLEKFKKDILNQ